MQKLCTTFIITIVLLAGNALGGQKIWSPGKSPFIKTADRLSWHNPSNWRPYGLPDRNDDVVIRSHIFLNGNAECRNLRISEYTLHMQGFTLFVDSDAWLEDFALIDPQGSGRLTVHGSMNLNGTLWVSRQSSFAANYSLGAFNAGALGSVIESNNLEFSGIPYESALKDWSKIRTGSSLLGQESWDGESGTQWSDGANWNTQTPSNGDNVVIGTLSVPDATISCDVSINGAGLDGGNNIIAGVSGSELIIAVEDNITVKFRNAGGVNAFGTDGTGAAITLNSIRFTQAGTDKTGKLEFNSPSSTFYFEDVTFDIGGSQFSDNYIFETAGSVFTFGDNINVRYLRDGNQTIETTIPTPGGENYQTLTIGGSGTKTLNGNTSADSTFIEEGSTLALGPNTLTSEVSVEGTLEYSFSASAVTGTVNAAAGGSSTVKYNGGNQSVGQGPFVNLELGGNGIKTFPAQNVTVTGALTVSNNVTALTQALFVVQLGLTGTLTENGTFTGRISATDADGNGTYGDIGISFAGTGGALGSNITVTRSTGTDFVRQYSGFGGNIVRSYALSGSLSSSLIPATNTGTVTLNYLGAELNGQIQNSLRAYRMTAAGLPCPLMAESSDGKFGEPMGGVLSKTFQVYRFFTGQAPDQGTDFYFANGSGSDAALPVELLHFGAQLSGEAIQLNWGTASETDNAGFILSRRESGSSFEEIASYRSDKQLGGMGNSAIGREYKYNDIQTLKSGSSYEYRLEDMSYAGKRTVLGTLSIVYVSRENLYSGPYPQPASDYLHFNTVSPSASTASLELFDAAGNIIQSRKNIVTGPESTEIDFYVGSFAAGIYCYKLVIPGQNGITQTGTVCISR